MKRVAFVLAALVGSATAACGGEEFGASSEDAGAGATGGAAGSGGSSAGASGASGAAGASGGAGAGGGSGGSAGAPPCLDAVECDDGNPCTLDLCDPSTGCSNPDNDGEACDDGVFCNGADLCQGGTCSVHPGDPCEGSTVCDESQKTCVGCTKESDCPDPTYGPWSSCSYADVCATSGTKQRTETTYTCGADGTCMPSMTTVMDSCSRSTNGATCASTTCGQWSSCSYENTCSEGGSQTRACTAHTCQGGQCKPLNIMENRTDQCARNTDGQGCQPDNDQCTADFCSNGTCTHPPLKEGSQCTSEGPTGMNYLCCGGGCRYTQEDDDHCGGCDVACTGTVDDCNAGFCRTCTSGTDCSSGVLPGFQCNLSSTPSRCQCAGDATCPNSWQSCNSGKCRGMAP